MMKRTLFAAAVAAAAAAPAAWGQGVPPLPTRDHLMCYRVQDPKQINAAVDMIAELQPEYSQKGCTILKGIEFCVPATKRVLSTTPVRPLPGQPLDFDYICYLAKCPQEKAPDRVVRDQFGERLLKEMRPYKICVPAQKKCGGGGGGGDSCNGYCPKDAEICAPDATGQCSCQPTPPPPDKCEDSAAPQCGGKCDDPTQTCTPVVTDAGGERCICQRQTSCPVGQPATNGLCGGTCGPGLVCRPDANDMCQCVPLHPPCKDTAYPTCGGACDGSGEVCRPTVDGECACVLPPPPPECETAGWPACSGTCPNVGERCVPDTTGKCRCYNPPPPDNCSMTAANQCGGSCSDPALKCQLNTAGECKCLPPPASCSMTDQNQCGGTCPPSMRCQLATDADGTVSCRCQPPPPRPCDMTAAGMCGGVCPNPDEQCVSDTAGHCKCKKPPPPENCGMNSAGQCGGVCPPGLKCSRITGTNLCKCLQASRLSAN